MQVFKLCIALNNTILSFARMYLRWLRRWPALLEGYHYIDSHDIPWQTREGCGPAVMQFVLRHYGFSLSLSDVEHQLLGRIPGGARVRRMAQYAEEMGFVARAYNVGQDNLAQLPLPSIAIVHRRHFIVLERIEKNEQLVIVDPSVGRCRIAKQKFLKVTNGGEMLLLAQAK